jgi:hypothetical protein
MPFNPGNKRAQRARNVPTLGGPMKFGLYPTVGVSLPFLRKLERCCGAKNGCGGGKAPLACGASVQVCAACGVPATCPANAPRGSCVSRADIKAALEPDYTAYCADCCGPVPLEVTALEKAFKKAVCLIADIAKERVAVRSSFVEAIDANDLAAAKNTANTTPPDSKSFTLLRSKIFDAQEEAIAAAHKTYTDKVFALYFDDTNEPPYDEGKLLDYYIADRDLQAAELTLAELPADATGGEINDAQELRDGAKTNHDAAWDLLYRPKATSDDPDATLPDFRAARDGDIATAQGKIDDAKLKPNTPDGIAALRDLV